MTFDQLLHRCRRTLDLHPDSSAGLRDFEKVIANNCIQPQTALSFYACLYRNLIEYIEAQRPEALPKYLPPEQEFAGTYVSGWNACLDAGLRVPHEIKEGEAGAEHRRGWNDCRAKLQAALSPLVAPVNQCDGCRRGLPTRMSKHGTLMHDGDDGMPVMACEKERYQPQNDERKT